MHVPWSLLVGRRVAPAWALAAVLGAGCGSSLDTDRFHAAPEDASVQDADSAVSLDTESDEPYTSALSGFVYAARACGECVDTACDAPMRTCLSDSTCSLYIACLMGCDDGPDCQDRCAGQVFNGFPHSVPGTREVLACVDARCSAECGVGAQGAGGESCGVLIDTPSCATCCCQAERDCFDSPTCFRAMECVPCDRTVDLSSRLGALDSCFDECIDAAPVPDGDGAWRAKLEAVRACWVSPDCTAVCAGPLPDDWSCAGKVQWATPSAIPIQMRIGVVDIQSGAGLIPGARVEQCYPGDECKLPIASTVTDERGIATFDLTPTALFGLVNYYYLFPELPGGDYYPLVVMPYVPLTVSYVNTGVLVPTRSYTESYAASVGVELDSTLGIIAVGLVDCLGAPPRGTTLRVAFEDPQPGAIIFGTVDGSPRLNETDSAAAIFNVQPGNVSLELHLTDESGTLVGRTSVMVRPGEMTQVVLTPTPL